MDALADEDVASGEKTREGPARRFVRFTWPAVDKASDRATISRARGVLFMYSSAWARARALFRRISRGPA